MVTLVPLGARAADRANSPSARVMLYVTVSMGVENTWGGSGTGQ